MVRNRNAWLAATLTGSTFLFGIPGASAQTTEADVVRLEKDLGEVEAREAKANARIEELEARIRRLEQLAVEPIGDLTAGSMRGRNVPPAAVAIADPSMTYGLSMGQAVASQTPPLEGSDRKTPAPSEAVEEVAAERQGRFGDRFGIDLGFGYTHFDNARINLDGFLALDAIFLGTINIDRVKADIFTIDPVLRFGLNDDLFFNADIPYFFRVSNFQSGGAGGSASGLVEKTVRQNGFGDASIGANYRLRHETKNWPDLVVNARVKFPTGKHPYGIEFVEVEGSDGNLLVPETLSTGTGVYGASIGLSALKTLDPMVLFGNVTYFHNFPRSFSDISENPGDQPGRVNVGSAFQLGAGLAFALNEKSSVSMSYTQRLVQRTKTRLDGAEWRPVVGSQANVALVNLGATFSLNRRLSLIVNTGVGLTDDSPDMAINIRVPVAL